MYFSKRMLCLWAILFTLCDVVKLQETSRRMNLETNIRVMGPPPTTTYIFAPSETTTTMQPSYIEAGIDWLGNLFSATKETESTQACSYLTYETRWQECDRVFRLTDHLEKISDFLADRCETVNKANVTTKTDSILKEDDAGIWTNITRRIRNFLIDPVNRMYFRLGSIFCLLIKFATCTIYLIVNLVLCILNRRLKKENSRDRLCYKRFIFSIFRHVV